LTEERLQAATRMAKEQEGIKDDRDLEQKWAAIVEAGK
jgi:hypothetical protein